MKTRRYARRVQAIKLWAGLLLVGLLAFSNAWVTKRYGAPWTQYRPPSGMMQALPDTGSWSR